MGGRAHRRFSRGLGTNPLLRHGEAAYSGRDAAPMPVGCLEITLAAHKLDSAAPRDRRRQLPLAVKGTRIVVIACPCMRLIFVIICAQEGLDSHNNGQHTLPR